MIDEMAEFDLYQFEDRVDDLLGVLKRLQVENRTLRSEVEAYIHRNAELKDRIQSVVERIRTLEEENTAAVAESES